MKERNYMIFIGLLNNFVNQMITLQVENIFEICPLFDLVG